ncbi:hypothetical protein [Rhizobium mongolense]|uniref:Uncharacterized protein n=1 Tax=Rhizobium mongolense TaxID=57676 RepID=A0A7W6RQX3_9HYPH|nr:hypothetical protein [Rhizobium mongolense]MBB4277018.1 hypothetical protein [Rhizobium mongolense]
MKNFIINEELANAVFNYLSTKPYREVAGLMAGLGQLQPVQLEQPAESKTEAENKS